MIARLLLPATLLVFISSFVQARDFPGYYINLKGDTIKCSFHFKDWEVTPDYVTVHEGSNTSALRPADISGFGVYNYGDYKSYEIKYHKGNYSAMDAPDTFSDSITSIHSFLKILQRGKYTLYERTESSRSYYFFSVNDGDLTELQYRVKRMGMNLDRDESYKKTIFGLFASEGISFQYSNDITKSVYSSRNIVPLFRILNEKTSGVKVVKKKKKLTQLELFAGALNHQFPGTVDGMYSERLNKFDGTQSGTGGINFQYFIPTNFRSIAVGVSVGYSKYATETSHSDSIKFYGSINNYRNTQYTEQFKLDNGAVMLDVYTQYIFNPLNKINVFAKAGLVTNFVVGGSQKIAVNYNSSTTGVSRGVPVSYTATGEKTIPLRKSYYNVHGGAGLITGRHKLEFTYYTPGVLNVAYVFKMKMMGVFYYYTIVRKG